MNLTVVVPEFADDCIDRRLIDQLDRLGIERIVVGIGNDTHDISSHLVEAVNRGNSDWTFILYPGEQIDSIAWAAVLNITEQEACSLPTAFLARCESTPTLLQSPNDKLTTLEPRLFQSPSSAISFDRIGRLLPPVQTHVGGRYAWTDVVIRHAPPSVSNPNRYSSVNKRIERLEAAKEGRSFMEHYRLAELYLERGYTSKACEAYDACHEQAPRTTAVFTRALAKHAELLVNQGGSHEAEGIFESHDAFHSSNPDLSFSEGLIRLRRRQYITARNCFQRARERASVPLFAAQDSRVKYLSLHGQASAEACLGNVAEAEVLWQRTITMAPLFRAAHAAYCELLYSQSRDNDLEAMVLEMSTDQRLYGDAQIWTAKIASRRGAIDDARMHLERAVRHSPKDPCLLRELARHYFDTEQFNDCQTIAKHCIDLQPNSPSNWDLFADSLKRTGDEAAAARTNLETASRWPDIESVTEQPTHVRYAFEWSEFESA